MKHTIATVATVIVMTLTVACAPARAPGLTRSATRLTGSSPVMTVEQLSELTGMTALDALGMLPAYFGRLHQAPAPRFALILDGVHASDLDVLKSICATELFEIRIRPASDASYSFGGPEVVVTTLAGRKRAR